MKNALNILLDNILRPENICSFYEKYELTSSHTYKDIWEQSLTYAKNLNEIIDSYNQPILISLETSKEFLFSFFGVILSGNIPVPVTSSTIVLPKDYKNLIEQVSESCLAGHIITKDGFSSKKLNHIKISELNKANEKEYQLPPIKEDQICFIQYSSGSTQAPKGVAVTHQNLMANLKQIHTGMEVTEKDTICSWLPLHHDMGLIGVLLASLYGNCRSHLMSPIDFILSPKSWLKLVSDEKISVIVAPNSAYNACCKKIKEQDKAELNLSNIRLALSGAEPVNREICEKFLNSFKECGLNQTAMFPVYGLAECTLAVTFNKVGAPLKYLRLDYNDLTKQGVVKETHDSEEAIDIVCCGSPLEGIKIEIRSETAKVMQENTVGEVFIKGPAVVSRYFNASTHLEDSWLASGDLGFLREGKLYIVGRKKDVIILNGRNISANDIETRACEIPQLKLGRTVAFSYQDKNLKEQVRLVAEVCELNKQKRNELKKEVCAKIHSIVPLTPDDISLVPPLLIKKTTSGKIKRYYIKQMYQISRVAKWEKFYRILFYRSQGLILWLRIKFFLKNNFFTFGERRKHERKNRYQYGTKK